MKKILIGAVAFATLSTGLFATESYEKAKIEYEKQGIDFQKLILKSENFGENYHSAKGNIGRFYDKAGVSATYEKALNVSLKELPSITYFEAEVGHNKVGIDGVFGNIALKNELRPFFWEQNNSIGGALKSGVGVVSKIELASATFEKETVKETITEIIDPFGFDNETIVNRKNIYTDERETDLLAGVGFSFEDKIFSLGGMKTEIILSKGAFGNIDFELEAKFQTRIQDNFVFELSGKNTAIGDENYKTITAGLTYIF